MADGGFDLNATVADPDFRQLPGTEKIKVLEHLDPDFRGLPLAEKAKVVASVVSPVPTRPEAPEKPGSFFGTLASDIATMPGGIVRAAKHPLETGVSIAAQQYEQFQKARQQARQGGLESVGAFGHGLAAALPVVGPAAAQAGEEFREGRWGPGWAHTVELIAPSAWGAARAGVRAVRPAARTAARLTPVEQRAMQAAEKAGVRTSVGQRSGRIGTQKFERSLQNLPGSEVRAGEFFTGQQEDIGKWGRQLAEKSAPQAGALGVVEAGEATEGALQRLVANGKGRADKIYDSIRRDAANAQATVQTGTRQVPGPRPAASLTPAGMPRTVPVFQTFEAPVDLDPVRQGLRPMYDDLERLLPEGRKAYSPAFTALKNLMNSGDRYMNAIDFDKSLSGIKALAREGDSPYIATQSQRLARATIAEGEKALSGALGKVSPTIERRLAVGRRVVREYHEAAELLQDLMGAKEEPANIYNRLASSGDRNYRVLTQVNQLAPGAVKGIGRSFLEQLIDKATKEGGFRGSEGLMKAWDKLGGKTKELMYGPKLTEDLNDFFVAAKKLAPAEGSATLGRAVAVFPLLNVLTETAGLGGAVLAYMFTGSVPEAGLGGLLARTGMKAAEVYLIPKIATRVLLSPGGANLMTRTITATSSAAMSTALRALQARAAWAAKQEGGSPEEQKKAPGPRASTTLPRSIPQALTAAAERHQLPPTLLHAVAQTESSGRTGAVSPKGATGLMQLMPATARQYGVRDIGNVAENIEGSARFLRHLWTKYHGNVALVAAAYNAGEGAVDRYGGVPPYQETRQYVQRVMNRMAG